MSSVTLEDVLQEELLRVWRQLLQNDAIGIDDDFFDNGGDSLLATELIAEIERCSGRTIPESLLFEASTVRAVARRLMSPAGLKAKAVVEVGPVGDATPLLFFHGDWGDGGFYTRPFARALAPALPLVAVTPHGLDDSEEVPGTVEEMAQERLRAIMEYRPRGPYRLGGHCVGGMVALEAARLLEAQGHEVEFVAMIEPMWTGSGEPYPMLDNGYLRPAMIAPGSATSEPVRFSLTNAPPEIDRRYAAALAKYRPTPLSTPIIVFASAYDGRPWQEISRSFKLFERPGGHYDWITTLAPEFASHLQAYMNSRS